MIYAIYAKSDHDVDSIRIIQSDPEILESEADDIPLERMFFHINYIVDTIGREGAASAYIVSRDPISVEGRRLTPSSPPWTPAALQAFPFFFYKIQYAGPSEYSRWARCTKCDHLRSPLKVLKIGDEITFCTSCMERLLDAGAEIYISADIDKIYEKYEECITRIILSNNDVRVQCKNDIARKIFLPVDNYIYNIYSRDTELKYCYKYNVFEKGHEWISDDMYVNIKSKHCGLHCIHCKYYFVKGGGGFLNPLTLKSIPENYLSEAMIVDRNMEKNFEIGYRGLYLKIIGTEEALFVPYHYAVENNIEARPVTMNEAKRIVKHSEKQAQERFRRTIELVIR